MAHSHSLLLFDTEEMDAREKLREAAYFLSRMNDLENRGVANEFIYNFDGFLVAWHGIVNDTILYDYAEKFKLPFTREEKMTSHDFAIAARALKERGEEKAIDFLVWLNSRVKDLQKNHDILFESRHVVIHRGSVSIGAKITEVAYGMSVSPAIYVVAPSPTQAGSIPPAAATPVVQQAHTTPQQPEAVTKYSTFRNLFYFNDDPKGRRVIDVCSQAYEDMEKLLVDAEKEVWKKKN